MSDQYNNIEDIVRANLIFHAESNGWNRIYCEVCGDGKRTKGPRGGWIFEDEYCAYHCFNCGIDSNFDPTREHPWSKEMYKVFEAFGIPTNLVKKLVADKKSKNGKPSTIPKRVSQPIKALEIPSHFYKLKDADPDNLIAFKATEYLRSRHVNPDSYPFYLSTGISNSDSAKEKSFAKCLTNRVIIPSFRNNEMVYFIARSLDKDTKIPYLNAPAPKENIIYGFDKLYANPKSILFVLEGFFDAIQVNGVAVLENHMTKGQVAILEKSPRQKVVIPDRHGDSKKLAEQALELGWGLSFPDIGDCKDISAAIGKYHKLYVIDSVMKNIQYGKRAKNSLKFL